LSPTAFSVHMGSLGDPIWTENAVDSPLAHVLVGEPDSTSPEHALSLAALSSPNRSSSSHSSRSIGLRPCRQPWPPRNERMLQPVRPIYGILITPLRNLV
jgi:hypothetical protein